jgi:hypothetical protein
VLTVDIIEVHPVAQASAVRMRATANTEPRIVEAEVGIIGERNVNVRRSLGRRGAEPLRREENPEANRKTKERKEALVEEETVESEAPRDKKIGKVIGLGILTAKSVIHKNGIDHRIRNLKLEIATGLKEDRIKRMIKRKDLGTLQEIDPQELRIRIAQEL